MHDPFEMFYTKSIEILAIEKNGIYEKTPTETPLKQVMADIQPYRGTQPFGSGIAEADYGERLDYQLKLYCKPCGEVTEGNFVRYGGKLYKIVYSAQWEHGTEALLKEVADDD